MQLNMKEVDEDSLELDGVDRNDYPDFCDAYFCYGRYVDGTELTDDELYELSDLYGCKLNEMAHESMRR